MRVTSGYDCIAVIVVKDLSCLGRTKSLSNAVIVCRIDDLGRFATRDLCAHSHPRRGRRVLFSSQSRYPDFEGKQQKLTDNMRVCKPLKNQHFSSLKVENPESPYRARSSKEIRFWGEKSPLGRRWGELGEKSQSNADGTYRYRTSKSRWLSA